jgi:hypothetical protein
MSTRSFPKLASLIALYDGVFKADPSSLPNVAYSTADDDRVTGAKRRYVSNRTGRHEGVGTNLLDDARPSPSGKFAGKVIHCRLPARLARPASKIQLLNSFSELVVEGDSLQLGKDLPS